MSIQKPLVVLFALTLFSGCIFRDRSEDYRRADSIEPIALPPGIRSTPLEPLYPIPEVQIRDEAFYDITTDGFVVPRPDALSPEREQAKIRIQRVAEQRWILAEAPASQVWPLAQSFLSRYGIGVRQSTPATGLVLTDWVVFRDDESMKSQFQIRIEKGVRPDSTEVHILHHQAPANAQALGPWPETSTDPQRESWLLEEMANVLAADIGNRAASLLGQSVGGDIKAELLIEGTEPSLRLSLTRMRAWATLAHALNREGFKVWGEDSQNGVFYVQYLDDSKRRSRVGRWFLGEHPDLTEVAPHGLPQVLLHLAPSAEVRTLFEPINGTAFGAPLTGGLGYLVVMQQQGGDYWVRIRDHRGERLDLAHNKRLLLILRRNLI